MSPALLLQVALQTITYASLYSLFGLGYVIIFRASRVFNFAIAQIGLFSALLFAVVYPILGLAGALIVGEVGSFILGGLLYVGLFSRLVGQEEWSQMIISFALGIGLLAVCGLLWGTGVRSIDLPGKDGVLFHIGSYATVSNAQAVLVISGFVVWGVLAWVTTGSRLGTYMRATAESPLLAAQQGLPVTLIISVAWGVGSMVSATAAISYGIRLQVDFSMIALGLVAVPAALLGGLDSVFGTLPGAIVLGFAQALGAALFSAAAGDAVAFGVLLIVLLVRPSGLFGSHMVRRI